MTTYTWKRLNHVLYTNYKNILLIPEKEFNKYQKDCEDSGYYLNIIRETVLTPIKDSTGCKEVIGFKDKYYAIEQDTGVGTVGYIYVGGNNFIKIRKKRGFIIPVLGVVLCATLIGLGVYFSQDTESTTGIKIDNSVMDWNGDEFVPDTPGSQQNINLPGFQKFTATRNTPYVKLYNPPSNNVYFTYAICNILGVEEVATLSTEKDAKEWIRDNDVHFTFEKKGNKCYIINDSTQDKEDEGYTYSIRQVDTETFVIEKEIYSLVFKTDDIPPGKQVLWNSYESLGTGEYNLRFKVSAKRVDTLAPCNGAEYKVKAIIN